MAIPISTSIPPPPFRFIPPQMTQFSEGPTPQLCWGPNFPKYCLIFMKFSPEVVFKETKTVFEESLENSNFYRNGRHPKFALLVQL